MHRIMLEASLHANNAFITLTYSDETLPASGSLIRKDLQDWLKRLRKAISPARVRYYAVGEYGEISQRPHYHVAMFGYSNCLRGRSRLGLMNELVTIERKCCPNCDLIAATWQKGGIYVGALEIKSAQYVAQYVMKKMTSMQDPRLHGRWPEFALMSRRPGLGVDAMHEVASVLMSFNLDKTQTDVPSVLQHGKKLLPLGRFLRVKLRKMMGKDEHASPEALEKINREMLRLLATSFDDAEAPSLKRQIVKRDLGKVRSIEARQNIHKGKQRL